MPNQKLKDAQTALRFFNLERVGYFVVSVVSVVILLGMALFVFVKNPDDWKIVTAAFFGPAGIIAYAQSRMLTLVNRVLSEVLESEGQP
jgi:hypothetical protein